MMSCEFKTLKYFLVGSYKSVCETNLIRLRRVKVLCKSTKITSPRLFYIRLEFPCQKTAYDVDHFVNHSLFTWKKYSKNLKRENKQ